MRRDIDVDKSAAFMFNHHKDAEEAEIRRDYNAEVTCHDAFGMIADKHGLPLRLTALTWACNVVAWHVFPHGSWRESQTELEQQFVGDPLLTPGGVILNHLFDEALQLSGDARIAGFRFPPPK